MASPALAAASPSHFGVKRIMKEYAEFAKLEAAERAYFTAAPCDDNLFEWHFTLRGPPDSEFAGGLYHGRILLPSQYPFKPPDIVLLTPSGRFEVNKKICLSISSFHPASWQPSWSIRTVLTALIAFMVTPGNGAIGSLDYSPAERRVYAAKSHAYRCELCGKTNAELMPELEGAAPALPQLSAEVKQTLEANKHLQPVVQDGTSQPATPALGPTSAPATPASKAAASASTPASAAVSATPAAAAAAAAAPATPAQAASAASAAASPLVLDEGLRQRQGRVVTPAAAAAAAAVAAPAAPAAAVLPVHPARAAGGNPGGGQFSSVTVFLFLLIVLILLRKLYASVHAKQAILAEFSHD